MLKDYKRDEALKFLIKNPGEVLYDAFGLPWRYDDINKVIIWKFKVDEDMFEEDEIEPDDFKVKFTKSIEFTQVID